MLVYKGKYNFAKIMVDEIDEETVKQIYNFLNHPAFKGTKIRIMPDTHAGAGAVIGYTATMNEYVIPNVVGVDIGCGIEAYNVGQNPIDFQRLDDFIRENIPSGFSINEKEPYIEASLKEKIIKTAEKIQSDKLERFLNSIGTLGGGNHFIEVDRDPEGNFWLVIHSGSRNFGLQVANYHQNKAKELMKKMFIGQAYKNLEFLPIENGGKEYLEDMVIAQEYARENRKIMAETLLSGFFDQTGIHCENIKTVHNYINFEDRIVRKGAISAHVGERLLIPLNMRDGTIVATGKGNPDWNFSAPHGAGRLFSRKKAKVEFTEEQFKNEMQDVWSSCVGSKTLDEAPMAYKNKEIIISAISATATLDFIMKPVYNFKGI